MGSRHRAHYGHDIFGHYAYAGIKLGNLTTVVGKLSISKGFH